MSSGHTVRSVRPEDQHFVPAGYLRGFLPDGGGALFVRRRQGTRWFLQKPENIATRRNYYSILREEGGYDDTVEHMLARHIEGPGLKALRKLKEGETIPCVPDRGMIAALLSVQYTRIPQIRDSVQGVLQHFTEAFTDEMFNDIDALASEVQNIEAVDRQTAYRTVRRWERLIKSGDIYPKVRSEASLSVMFSAVADGAAIFSDMDWMVYVSKEPAFFTSDCPVYISPASVAGHENIGTAMPGVIIHAPISSRRCLTLSGLRHRHQMLRQFRSVASSAFIDQLEMLPPVVVYKEADAALIRELNDQTARCAGDWVCGPFESSDMERALELPRIRTEFQVTRERTGMRVDHRIVNNEE